jgi:hypothetical protein
MRTINEVTGHHFDMRHLSARVLMVVLAVAAVVAGTPASASAAGDAELDGLIVTTALPGWTPLPTTLLEQTVTSERNAVGAATDHTFHVAVEGWRQGTQSLVVVLISFPNGDPPGDFKARDAVVGACGAATKKDPQSMQSYGPIADSTEAMCVGKSAAGIQVDAAVMAWKKQSVFALTIGNQFSTMQLERFAVVQNAALPGSAPTQSSGSSGSDSSNTALFVIIGIVAAVGAALLIVVISRSRRQTPTPVQALSAPVGVVPHSTFAPPAAPSPSAPDSPFAAPSPFATPSTPVAPSTSVAPAAQAPGWQAADGDPTRIAYWDGSRFTAWKRWDGANWVD